MQGFQSMTTLGLNSPLAKEDNRTMRIFGPIDADIRKATGDLGAPRIAGLRFFYFDGLFASLSDNLVAGFLELFLLSYGVSNEIIGLNTATANLCASLSIVPGAMAISRIRSRKRLVVLTGGGIGRVGLLAISLVPFIAGDSGLAVVSLVALNALRSVMGNFCNPAWTSMVADLVPLQARARYFGKRNVAIIVASILASPIAGKIVKSLSGIHAFPHLGFQAIFFLSFAVGMLSTASFSRIPDASVSEASSARPKGFPLRELLADRRFMGFAASALVWNTALQVSSPFFNVYLVSRLGASAAMVGFLTAVSSVTTLLGQLALGRATDKKGDAFVLVLTGLLIPFLPLSWILVTRPQQVAYINTASGILWAGYNLACFNILLKLTPDDRRAEATAVYQTLVTASAVIGPVIGGALADSVGYTAVFALSGAGRFVGILLFIALVLRPGPLRARH
jgi:MFS family permease